MKKYRSSIL